MISAYTGKNPLAGDRLRSISTEPFTTLVDVLGVNAKRDMVPQIPFTMAPWEMQYKLLNDVRNTVGQSGLPFSKIQELIHWPMRN